MKPELNNIHKLLRPIPRHSKFSGQWGYFNNNNKNNHIDNYDYFLLYREAVYITPTNTHVYRCYTYMLYIIHVYMYIYTITRP